MFVRTEVKSRDVLNKGPYKACSKDDQLNGGLFGLERSESPAGDLCSAQAENEEREAAEKQKVLEVVEESVLTMLAHHFGLSRWQCKGVRKRREGYATALGDGGRSRKMVFSDLGLGWRLQRGAVKDSASFAGFASAQRWI